MILPDLQGQDISRYVVQHKYDAFWDYFVQSNAVECSCGAAWYSHTVQNQAMFSDKV